MEGTRRIRVCWLPIPNPRRKEIRQNQRNEGRPESSKSRDRTIARFRAKTSVARNMSRITGRLKKKSEAEKAKSFEPARERRRAKLMTPQRAPQKAEKR